MKAYLVEETILPATGSIAARTVDLNGSTKGRENPRGQYGQRKGPHGSDIVATQTSFVVVSEQENQRVAAAREKLCKTGWGPDEIYGAGYNFGYIYRLYTLIAMDLSRMK